MANPVITELGISSSEKRPRELICFSLNVSLQDRDGGGATKAAIPAESVPGSWSHGAQGWVTDSKRGAVFFPLLTHCLISTFTGDHGSHQV